jgi:FkbM family methyltransferase
MKLKMFMEYIPGNLTSTWGASVVMKITESPKQNNKKVKHYETEVPCYPLYSLMLASNYTTVDLLSLDVEGAELDVLRTVPWNVVTVHVRQ